MAYSDIYTHLDCIVLTICDLLFSNRDKHLGQGAERIWQSGVGA